MEHLESNQKAYLQNRWWNKIKPNDSDILSELMHGVLSTCAHRHYNVIGRLRQNALYLFHVESLTETLSQLQT